VAASCHKLPLQLYGLLQALHAQGKDERAALIEERFKKAWVRADVNLKASRFGCIAAPAAGAAGTVPQDQDL